MDAGAVGVIEWDMKTRWGAPTQTCRSAPSDLRAPSIRPIGAGGGTAAPSSPDRGWRGSLEIIRMMMESGFLICRYHRTSPGLANPGITMFKNPTSKFQMFKGTDRSEGGRGAALAAARLPVTATSISHPPYFEPTRRLRERAEKTGSIPRAWLPRHHHLFCQSFGRNFRRRNFCA